MFGAKWDGASDDTPAIQVALDSYDTVFLPEGVAIIKTVYVDSGKRLYGSGAESSILQKMAGDNAPAVAVINTVNANVPGCTTLDNFGIIGGSSLDVGLDKQHGIIATSDPEKGGQHITRFVIHDVSITRMSGNGLFLNGATGSSATNMDIQYNRLAGVLFHNDHPGAFNNAIRVTHNRIKHNSIGVFGQGFANPGISSPPSGAFSSEIFGNTIAFNLIEQNSTSPTTGDFWDYADKTGTLDRPGIGVLLEGGRFWNINDNWLEGHFNHIKFNGYNKFVTVTNNTFNATSAGAYSATAPDLAGNIVFVAQTAELENARNIVFDNLFTTKNERSGGAFFGEHVLLEGVYSQSNRFLHNRTEYTDGGIGVQTGLVITPGANKADKNLIIDMKREASGSVNETSNSSYVASRFRASGAAARLELFDAVTSAPAIRVGSYSVATNHSLSIEFKRVDQTPEANVIDDRGAISLSARWDANGYDDITIMKGRGDPEGIVVAGRGSLYLRTDGGAGSTLYVKQTGSGNTGWAAK